MSFHLSSIFHLCQVRLFISEWQKEEKSPLQLWDLVKKVRESWGDWGTLLKLLTREQNGNRPILLGKVEPAWAASRTEREDKKDLTHKHFLSKTAGSALALSTVRAPRWGGGGGGQNRKKEAWTTAMSPFSSSYSKVKVCRLKAATSFTAVECSI